MQVTLAGGCHRRLLEELFAARARTQVPHENGRYDEHAQTQNGDRHDWKRRRLSGIHLKSIYIAHCWLSIADSQPDHVLVWGQSTGDGHPSLPHQVRSMEIEV